MLIEQLTLFVNFLSKVPVVNLFLLVTSVLEFCNILIFILRDSTLGEVKPTTGLSNRAQNLVINILEIQDEGHSGILILCTGIWVLSTTLG